MIRILIADDHSLVRAGLAQLLSDVDDFQVVGTAADGRDAVALATETGPDVVLMDLSMPGLDGVAAIRQIVARDPESRVVVLTSFSDVGRIFEALDAGAIGYLLKDSQADELVLGIRAAARGESPLAPKAAREVIARRRSSPADQLTERELEVLVLLARGNPNKVIARRLAISEKTVKNHITSIFQALGVSDRTQAALWAQRHGVERLPTETWCARVPRGGNRPAAGTRARYRPRCSTTDRIQGWIMHWKRCVPASSVPTSTLAPGTTSSGSAFTWTAGGVPGGSAAFRSGGMKPAPKFTTSVNVCASPPMFLALRRSPRLSST
jgi:DNA-binding NarL/FixJ family response regulator